MNTAKSRKQAALLVACTGLATLASFGIMVGAAGGDPVPLVDTSYAAPGQSPESVRAPFRSAVVWLEVPADRYEVFQNLGNPETEPGREIRRRVDLINRIDYAFMVAYSAFTAALFWLLFLLKRSSGHVIFGELKFFHTGLVLAGAMLVGDALENLALLRLTDYSGPGAIPDVDLVWLSVTTRLKWFALWASCLLLGVGFASHFAGSPALLLSIPYSLAGIVGLMSFLIPGQRSLLETAASLMAVGWFGSLGYANFLIWKGEDPGK